MHDSREEIRVGNTSLALPLVVWNCETGIARLLGEIIQRHQIVIRTPYFNQVLSIVVRFEVLKRVAIIACRKRIFFGNWRGASD